MCGFCGFPQQPTQVLAGAGRGSRVGSFSAIGESVRNMSSVRTWTVLLVLTTVFPGHGTMSGNGSTHIGCRLSSYWSWRHPHLLKYWALCSHVVLSPCVALMYQALSRGSGGLALGLDPRPVPGEGSLAEILLCLPQCRHQRLIEIIWSFKITRFGGTSSRKTSGKLWL